MMRTSPIGDHSFGFTLLELLLAITLGTIVLSTVYSTFTTALDSQRRIARVATDTQAWRFFAERLRVDINNLLTGEQALAGNQETLALTTAPPPQAPLQIRYEHQKTPSGGQIRRRAVSGEDESDTLVYEGVEKLSFRYLRDGDWRSESGEELPRAVECTVAGAGWERQIIIGLEVEHGED